MARNASSVAAWLLITTATTAVMVMGSVEGWQLSIVAVLAALTLVAASATAEPIPLRREARLLLGTAVGLTAYSALQLVPLPHSVVARLSPHAADVWDRCLHPFGERGPAWHPLSLDPYATSVETLKGLTYLSCFAATLLVAKERRNGRLLTRALILLPVAVAVVALVHEGLGLQRVWGLYAPRTAVSSISPLMNANQLSGFCAIGLLCAAGSTFSTSPALRRSVTAIIVVGLAGAEIWWASRGALGALFTGLIVVAWYSLVARGKASVVAARWGLPLVIAIAGVAMLLIAASQAVRNGLEERDISKLIAAKAALLHLVPKYIVFGTGRGAFQSAFPEFAPETGFFVFTHPENVLAEWATGWGAPAAAAALLAIAYALRPSVLTNPSRATVGIYAAVVALALQNLVDFSSEIPGVMLTLTIAVALLVSSNEARLHPWRPSRPSVLVGCATTLVFAAFVAHERHHDLATEQDEIAAGLRAKTDVADLMAHIRAARLQHPAEPYFPYAGALVASRQAIYSVPLWAGAALERSPRYGPAHVILARWLRNANPSQARLEYRLAQEQGLPWPLSFAELDGLADDFNSAVEVALPDSRGVSLLNYFEVKMAPHRPASANLVDDEILRRSPRDAEALVRRANAAWLDIDAGAAAPWCVDLTCYAELQHAAGVAVSAAPDRCDGYLLLARLHVALGQPRAAVESMRGALDNVTDWATCDAALARLAIDTHQDAEASAAIDALVHRPCVDNQTCTDLLMQAAALEAARNSPRRAIVLLRRAKAIEPTREDILRAVIAAASQLELHAEAADAYRALLSMHPTDAVLQNGLAKELGREIPPP